MSQRSWKRNINYGRRDKDNKDSKLDQRKLKVRELHQSEVDFINGIIKSHLQHNTLFYCFFNKNSLAT